MRVGLVFAIVISMAGLAMAASGVVNVNTADVEQLTLLPRIGPSVAKRIVEYREQHGAFKRAEDLLLIRGIGDSTFERLKPYVATKGETTLKEKVKVPREPKKDEPKAKGQGQGTA